MVSVRGNLRIIAGVSAALLLLFFLTSTASTAILWASGVHVGAWGPFFPSPTGSCGA